MAMSDARMKLLRKKMGGTEADFGPIASSHPLANTMVDGTKYGPPVVPGGPGLAFSHPAGGTAAPTGTGLGGTAAPAATTGTKPSTSTRMGLGGTSAPATGPADISSTYMGGDLTGIANIKPDVTSASIPTGPLTEGKTGGNSVKEILTGPDGKAIGYVGWDGNTYMFKTSTPPTPPTPPAPPEPRGWPRTYNPQEHIAPIPERTFPTYSHITPTPETIAATAPAVNVTPAGLAAQGITSGVSGFERAPEAGLVLPSMDELKTRFMDAWRQTKAGPKTENEALAWMNSPQIQRIFATGHIPDYLRNDPRMRLLLQKAGLLPKRVQ